MKKKICLKIITMICLVLCAFALLFKESTTVYADEDLMMVVSFGTGKVETTATSATLNFNLKITSENFDNGQNLVNDTFKNISENIKSLNSENVAIITYSSCYPIFNDSLKLYNFSCSFDVKTKDINSINDVIKIVAENENVSYYGVNYQLDDEQKFYLEALDKAKEDALVKAQNFNSQLKLKAITSINVCSYSGEAQTGKIIIEANIKGIFVSSAEDKEISSQVFNSHI